MAVISHLTGFRCVRCGSEQPAEPSPLTCAECGGNLDAVYNYAAIAAGWSKEALAADPDRSLWRYLPLLPVSAAPEKRSLLVGGTPLVHLEHVARELGLAWLGIKDDTRNPSASLKDRASEVAIRHAAESGRDTLVVASTGNAAASLAALCAWHGARAVVLAPASAPAAKLTQVLQYGALLCPVDGSYDDAFDLARAVAEERGWYLRSTGVNPVMSEGKKTVALEFAEQLGWEVPDTILVPVGDGCIIGGVHKGLSDLVRLGWIERMPRIAAIQAEGSSSVADAVRSGGPIVPVRARTVADSISVDLPRDGDKALRAVRETNGFALTVSDEEILRAQQALASRTGIFAEPAAAAAWAGLLKARRTGEVRPGQRVLVLITGSGLKDIPAAQRRVHLPDPVEPTLGAVMEFLESRTE